MIQKLKPCPFCGIECQGHDFDRPGSLTREEAFETFVSAIDGVEARGFIDRELKLRLCSIMRRAFGLEESK